MGMKDTIGRALGEVEAAVERTVDKAKDAINESKHRAEAAVEHNRRELAGDEMDPATRIGSVANEIKNDVQADVAQTKRSLRDNP
jgi:hypothetical protein